MLAEIAERALGLRGLQPFVSAAQMRAALTTYLWGHREAPMLPNAATIIGPPTRPSTAASAAATAATVRTRKVPPRASGRGKLATAAALALALMGIAAAVWHDEPDPGAPATAAGAWAVPPKPRAATVPMEPATTAATSAPRTSAQTTRFGPVAANTAADSHGVVHIAVAPWGEVYVDGASRGMAPPLRQLTLPPGLHTIEVRNGDRPPHVAQVEVAADRPQRVAHRFQ
jgi:serine/threonine-protein kinase